MKGCATCIHELNACVRKHCEHQLRSGVGLGGGVGCNVDGCGAYISVAAIGSINIPTPVAAGCPFGATVGAATCAQAFGGGISTMCCNMDLRDGSNDCR